MLTMSTYFHPPPTLFFTFVLLNGIAQATAGSYLQTAVVAVASLFGHTAMQSVMTGQAAVGVVVSGLQVLSAAASTRSAGTGEPVDATSEPEEDSAFTFFAVSTLFLIVTIGVYSWLVSLPDYKALVRQTASAPRSETLRDSENLDEASGFLASENHVKKSDSKDFMWRLTKMNAEFNIAVAYVFVVTLVRLKQYVYVVTAH